MKKVLILSASFGGGHNSTANAIKEELEDRNDFEVKILDTVEYVSPEINNIAIAVYNSFTRNHHKLYKIMYSSTNKNGYITKFTQNIVKAFSPILKNKIVEYNPDYIICTHPFPEVMVTFLKKKNKIKDINTSVILTDFEVHEFWIVDPEFLNNIFVSTNEMKEDLVENHNVKEDIIYVTGIPIKKSFLNKLNNEAKEKLKKDLKISKDNIAIYFAGGAMGLSDSSFVSYFIKFAKGLENYHFIVITGKNDKLYKAYDDIISKENISNATILKFVDNIPELMDISNFVISKPGGLTTSESLAKGLAMIIINPIPGQEESNTKFIESNNAGIRITNDNIDNIIYNIQNDENFISEMKENAEKIGKINSTKNVIDIILDSYNKD